MALGQDIIVETEALQVFTAEEALFYRLLPYRLDGSDGLLCLGETGRQYDTAIKEIAGVFGKRVAVKAMSAAELNRLLAVHYRSGIDSVSVSAANFEDIPSLIDEAYRMRASDIHMEPSEHRCRIRFRIDGKLLERHIIPKASYMALVNRIKIMSNLDISEKRLPQDGRIIHEGKDARFDIRTSILPTIYGEKIVLRLLTMNNRHLSLPELGFDKRQYDDYVRAVSHPHGMILISGPTGSGKSTTLYATLELLNRGDNNILTIEDPVEYTLEGVNQVQLREDIGLDFPMALRTFLRQDPDIIMLGEIRDEVTAEMAIRSSLTGHLLLSTLHTNSAWGCITRLVDMGVHPYLLSETLIACVAQRLVRTLCPHCKQPVGDGTYKPVGCSHCFYTGYMGRKALYEVLPIDADLSMAIRESRSCVEDIVKTKGMRTLKDAAADLYRRGETSLEEVLPFMK